MIIQYLYYNQPQAITFFKSIGYNQLQHHFLFVDDASKLPLHISNWKTAETLRIKNDVPWNQPAANNIAFWHLYNQNPEAVVLRMDIDHYFSPSDLEKISQIQVEKHQIIHFKRQKTTSHPNIYLARVSDLLYAGGYNEDFCGNYGYDDKEFMYRLRKNRFIFTLSNIKAQINNGFGTKNLSRDASINYQKYKNIITP